ncbi:hypothetical protein BH23BAC1_BH23BAC1_24540 [soil metagenome]
MVEVFKTNVKAREQANVLLEKIHHSFPFISANFDLEDCDKILRVEFANRNFKPEQIINLLKKSGSEAEVLADTYQPLGRELEIM